MSSIHARMPTKKDYENSYSDDDSYDMLDEHSLDIKQEEIDSDNYSIYSDDDRKRPAQVQQPPTSIAIKQESDTESISAMGSNCLERERTAPYIAPLDQERSFHDEANLAIKEEILGGKGKHSARKSQPKRKVRRRLIYNEISYFDTIDKKDDDPDERSPNRGQLSGRKEVLMVHVQGITIMSAPDHQRKEQGMIIRPKHIVVAMQGQEKAKNHEGGNK